MYLQNTPPFFNIKDSRGIPNTIRNTKSVPPGTFKPSPIIHEAKKYPEHFTNPIENTKFPKFPKLPEYPVSRPQHGYSKLPSSFNELPKHEFPSSFYNGNRGVSQYHHEPYSGNYPKLPPLNNGESGHISDYTNGGPNVPHYHSVVPSFMKGGGSPFKNNHPKLANPGQLPENIREFLPDIPTLDTDDRLVPTSEYHSKGAKSLHYHNNGGGRGPNVPDYHSVIPSFMKGGTPFKNNHRLPSKLASNSNLPDNIREFLPDVPTLNTDDHLVPTTGYHSKGGKLFGYHHSSEPEVPHYHSVIPSFSKNTAPFREKHPGNSLPPLRDIPKGIGHFKLDLPKIPNSFGNGGIPGKYHLQGGKLPDPNRGLKNSFGNQLGFKNYANSQLSASNGFDNYKVHHKRQILPDEGRDTSFPKIPAFEHQEFGFKNPFSHIESIADNFKHEVPKYGDPKPPPHQPEYHQPEYHEPKPPKKPNFKPPNHQPYRPPKKPNFKPPKIPMSIVKQSPYLDGGTKRGKNQTNHCNSNILSTSYHCRWLYD